MKIFLDSTQHYEKFRIQELVALGHTLHVGTNFVDMEIFQKDHDMAYKFIEAGALIIERTQTLDEMVQKNFFWSSRQLATHAAASFKEAIKRLPDYETIDDLGVLVEKFGTDKWTRGIFQAPVPLAIEEAERLGVTDDAPRSAIYVASERLNRPELYQHLNKMYITSIAKQHTCDAVLLNGGRLKEFA